MFKTNGKLLLLFLMAFPGMLLADSGLTPGHCAGYMPVILEYDARSSERREVSESSGSLHILQARKSREKARRYIDNSRLMRELHQRKATSDFERDHKFAESLASQRASFLGSATAKQIQRDREEFEGLEKEINNMTERCDTMLAEASKIGNNRALGSFFESITKGEINPPKQTKNSATPDAAGQIKPVNPDKSTDAPFFSQSVLAALIVAGPPIKLNADVRRDRNNTNLIINTKLIINKIHIIDRELQRDVVNIRNLHFNDQKLHKSDIPVTSIQDFSLAGELNARLEEIENRDIDLQSFVYMTEALESYFGIRFSTQVDRNVCWGILTRPFRIPYEKETNPELAAIQKGCEAFNRIHDTIIEMRKIDRMAEARRAIVSQQEFGGRIGPRENAFRDKQKPWYRHLKQ